MIDTIDLEILNILQDNGRVSNAQIARQLGMAPSGILERIKKLEKKNIIRGYEVRLDGEKLGLSILAFIHVLSSDTVGSTAVGRELAKIPEIQEVHWIAGNYNYLVKARLNSTSDLNNLLKKFGEIPGLKDTRTTLVLETLKERHTFSEEQLSRNTRSSG